MAKGYPVNLDKEQELEIIRLYNIDNMSIKSICKRFYVGDKQINKILESYLVKIKLVEITKELEDRIVEIYNTTKLGIRPIAKQIGISPQKIREILNNKNIKPKPHTNNEIILSELQTDKIINLYKNGTSIDNIAQLVNINYGKIRKILLEHNIYKPYKQNVVNFSEGNINEIIKLYNSGESLDEVGKIFNVCNSTIKKVLIKQGISIRSCSHFSRKHQINEEYFKQIDTKDRAYFLGLLCADGHNHKDEGGFGIKLKESDVGIIKLLKFTLQSEHPIRYIKYPNNQNQYSFNVGSKKISSDLIKLGCHSNKSLNMTFPNSEQVPVHLMNHFLRGIFCGDGCISNYRCKRGYVNYVVDITGGVKFIMGVRNYIYKQFGFHGHLRIIKNKNEYARWSLSSYNQIIIFLDWLYKDCEEFKLNRKYNRYITMKTQKDKLFYSHYRKNNKNNGNREYRAYGNRKCISRKMEFI